MKKKPIRKKKSSTDDGSTPAEPTRRKDFVVNDELISATFAKLWLQNKKVPSYEDIARELDLNVSTVKRHVKEMDFEERFQKFRCVSDQVIMNVFKQASTGKQPRYSEMWLELFEGLGSKKTIDINTPPPVNKVEIIHTNAGPNAQG